MKRETIGSLLPLLNSEVTGHRLDWVLGYCPLAPWRHSSGKDSHPSFGIKASPTKKSIFHCMSCGGGGDLMDLLMQVSYKVKALSLPGYNLAAASALINGELDELEFDGHGIPDFPETHQDSPDTVFPEWWLDTFPSVSTVPIATTYLQNRGLTLAVMRALDIRYDPAQHRVAFPFRNSKRELVGLQGRVIDNSHPLRYFQYGFHGKRNMQHWMGEDFVDMDKPVVLLEGPFDLASVFRVYQNVAASFTSGLSMEKVKRFMDADSIITLYDHGSGGDSARKRIQEVLGTRPIAHIIPTPQEGDAGNMDQDTVARYLQDHVRLRYFG